MDQLMVQVAVKLDSTGQHRVIKFQIDAIPWMDLVKIGRPEWKEARNDRIGNAFLFKKSTNSKKFFIYFFVFEYCFSLWVFLKSDWFGRADRFGRFHKLLSPSELFKSIKASYFFLFESAFFLFKSCDGCFAKMFPCIFHGAKMEFVWY